MGIGVPAFDRRGVRLYQGDARALAPALDVTERTVVVTDPVWPNSARTTLAGREDPEGLFGDVIGPLVARGLRRLIVILGVDSDPRFLVAVPGELPFVRAVWLRYAFPTYKGPVLNGAEVAYVFGTWGMAYPGQKVWPGEILATEPRARARATVHPCPRRPEHIRGLLVGYTRADDVIVDPFAGSGTTLAVALELGRAAVGLEVEPAYVAEAVERLADASGAGVTTPGLLFAGR